MCKRWYRKCCEIWLKGQGTVSVWGEGLQKKLASPGCARMSEANPVWLKSRVNVYCDMGALSLLSMDVYEGLISEYKD